MGVLLAEKLLMLHRLGAGMLMLGREVRRPVVWQVRGPRSWEKRGSRKKWGV